jgi:hypothetical protein
MVSKDFLVPLTTERERRSRDRKAGEQRRPERTSSASVPVGDQPERTRSQRPSSEEDGSGRAQKAPLDHRTRDPGSRQAAPTRSGHRRLRCPSATNPNEPEANAHQRRASATYADLRAKFAEHPTRTNQ